MRSVDLEEMRTRGQPGWIEFVEVFAAVVYRAAERAAHDPEEGRTVAADVLERLHADWPSILDRFLEVARSERADFGVWLAVVTRRLAIDVLRQRHGRRTVPAHVRRGAPWLRRAWKLRVVEGRPTTEIWTEIAGRDGAPTSEGELELLLAELDGTDRESAARRRTPTSLGDGQASVPATAAAPLERSIGERGRARFRELIGELTGEERLLLRLYFLEGSSAEALRLLFGSQTRSQVYNRVHSLTKRIRAQLASDGLSMDDLGDPRELDLGAVLESRASCEEGMR